ncbi:MAG: tetratricopeptide repeat protein [Candidatus Cloacimonetes bacterium]|nr:tetratricopeptide repeat protein [Candidatus Cloacimonadota bacterium]MBL7148896.1 tetratricopeptide repeat protein [Candidatus Cloacimonadota bacterium]
MNFLQLLKAKRLQIKGQKFLTSGKIEKAHGIFQKVVLIDNSTENLFNLALSFMGLVRYSEAEGYLRKIKENFPDHELNTLTLAECLIMQKKWDEAIKFYEKASQINPCSEAYKKYVAIAKDVVAREKYVKSKEFFQEAIEELRCKNDEKALKIMQEANEYFPRNPNILNNIGTIYLNLKKYKPAYSYFAKAISLDPENKKFQKNLLTAKRKIKIKY